MRFSIDAQPSGGLRVISEVPDGQLLQIEGRNGVGKTLAIRLLQLVTGGQPYLERSQSWVTLRENLNPVTITVEGLKGQHSLRFELDPDHWPSEPEAAGDWLGRAYFDDEAIPWGEVSGILRVRRIGGDETLGESLAAQVATDAEILRLTIRRQESRREEWGDLLTALRIVTDVTAVFDISSLRATHQAAVQELAEAEKQFKTAKSRRERAEELDRLLELLENIQAKEPGLRRLIASQTIREDTLRKEVADLDSEAADVLARNKQAQALMGSVARLVGLQRKRLDRRERRRREVAEVSRRAGLEMPVDLQAAEQQLTQLRQSRKELVERRQSVDRAGLMLELLDAVEVPVARGLAARLEEEVIARIDLGPVRVGELAAGLDSQRESLEGIERAGGDELLSEIATIDRRIAAGVALPDAVRLMVKAEADFDETTAELAALLSDLESDVAGDYEEVSARRATLLDELTLVVEERSQAEADLEALFSGGSADELRRLIEDEKAGLSVDESRLGSDSRGAWLETLVEDHDGALERRRSAADRRNGTREELARAEAAVRGASAAIVDGEEFRWLGQEALPVPDPEADAEDQLDVMRSLAAAADRVEQLLLQTLNDQQALGRALASLEERLRASSTVGKMQRTLRGEFAVPVERYYEARFAQELSNDMVSAALFSGGVDIAVDLKDMTTSWTSADGQRNARPLEAFSSGERAFAYTRVQVERLTSVASANRVVFLDEFGSFVADDRFEQLKRYLRNQAIGTAADKIVVVLPVRHSPTREELDELDRRGGFLVRDLD